MPVIRTMCCAAALVLTVVIPDSASAAAKPSVVVIKHNVAGAPKPRAAAPRAAAPRAAAPRPPVKCILPTDVNHLPHPALSARLDANGTVTFSGTTCPGALIGVFEVHGKRVRNAAEYLVCDDLANLRGQYSCTSVRRYPITTKFGVVISGQYIVGLQIPAVALHPRHPHPHPRPHGAPQTGLGGMAGAVSRHHLRELAHQKGTLTPSPRAERGKRPR